MISARGVADIGFAQHPSKCAPTSVQASRQAMSTHFSLSAMLLAAPSELVPCWIGRCPAIWVPDSSVTAACVSGCQSAEDQLCELHHHVAEEFHQLCSFHWCAPSDTAFTRSVAAFVSGDHAAKQRQRITMPNIRGSSGALAPHGPQRRGTTSMQKTCSI